jgi:molybdopterin converting factor subunit 1
VKVEILYFAQVRDAFGREREVLALDAGATVADAVDVLRARDEWTAMEPLPLTFAVNEEVVTTTHRLSDGDRLALLPPVSGG